MRATWAAGMVFVVVLAAMTTQADVVVDANEQQQPPQNLQVLPKDMTRADVTALMRTVAASLGVQCNHCHVGSPADRAKDDLPTKALARQMFRMSMAINNDLLKDVGKPVEPGQSKVTCFTCHRGALKPLTAPAAGSGN